jgi:hypothetical protein
MPKWNPDTNKHLEIEVATKVARHLVTFDGRGGGNAKLEPLVSDGFVTRDNWPTYEVVVPLLHSELPRGLGLGLLLGCCCCCCLDLSYVSSFHHYKYSL